MRFLFFLTSPQRYAATNSISAPSRTEATQHPSCWLLRVTVDMLVHYYKSGGTSRWILSEKVITPFVWNHEWAISPEAGARRGIWMSEFHEGGEEALKSIPFLVPICVPLNLHLGNSRACFLCFPSNFSISLSFRPTKQCQTSHNPINQRSVRNRSFEIPSPPSGFRGFPCWLILTNPEVHRQSEINLCYIQ